MPLAVEFKIYPFHPLTVVFCEIPADVLQSRPCVVVVERSELQVTPFEGSNKNLKLLSMRKEVEEISTSYATHCLKSDNNIVLDILIYQVRECNIDSYCDDFFFKSL